MKHDILHGFSDLLKLTVWSHVYLFLTIVVCFNCTKQNMIRFNVSMHCLNYQQTANKYCQNSFATVKAYFAINLFTCQFSTENVQSHGKKWKHLICTCGKKVTTCLVLQYCEIWGCPEWYV